MINLLATKTTPDQFDIQQIFENKEDGEIAEEVADFFTSISNDFVPLSESDVLAFSDTEQCTKNSVTSADVKKRLLECKKGS